MQRRVFIRNTALSAVAVSTAGFIRFNGTHFEGDCETTTDILGPFYRPDAPLRMNMRLDGHQGTPIVLSGQIMHKDCKTPLENACVELWHCDEKGVYDNDSPDFRYRAKTYCDAKGKYSFQTILPVPYDVGTGTIRPAHFHMLITARGYQALITQLYFTGDKYIATDASASSPAAKRRILNVQEGAGGERAVAFDVTMMEKLPADQVVIDRIAGPYARKGSEPKTEEFYRKEGLLWIKDASSINGGYPLQYIGNNAFQTYGRPRTYQFTVNKDGSVSVVCMRVQGQVDSMLWDGIKSGK